MLRRTVSRAWFGVIVFLSIATMPAHAVEIFKFSNYQGGHQIWFEVENFDQRIPDTNDDYILQNDPDAFGDAELNIINRAGGDGGRLTYNFNIGVGGGQAGAWFHWGRVINPSNRSDYLLVEGDPDDFMPSEPPFDESTIGAVQPGGSFTNGDHRMFERNTGPPWGWSGGDAEGHRKLLSDGPNTMHIVHRQGNDTVSWDVMMWSDSPDYVPTDDDYINSLVPVENPGDFNDDGQIDFADALIMAENFNAKFPFAEAITKGDVNGDTRVDLADFLAFRVLFNAPPAAGQAAVAPEPNSLMLLSLAACGLLRGRRRRRCF